MSATTLAIVAVIIWLFAMGASWCLSWMNALSAIFVAGVIVIGVAVSWQRVEQQRADKDAVTAFYNRPNPATVTVPPPDHPRAGT
jgi:4-hydroxybenzoate polyprenyltransferase